MSEKMRVNPYLFFDGNCREAMTFYKDALSADLEIMPFEGAPMEVPEGYGDKVMHSTLTFGDACIMASDPMPGQPVDQGSNFSVSIDCETIAEGQTLFDNLSEGGTVIMPFEDTFWGARFGMFRDKFGISWMINCDQKA